jgi:transposase-like protein
MSSAESAWERWTRVIDEQRRSGLSVAVFCRERSVPPSSFFAWRRKLNLGQTSGTGGAGEVMAGFVEARVVDQQAGDGQTAARVCDDAVGVTIELAGGRRLLVKSGFNRQTLLDVIGVLEGLPATLESMPDASEAACPGRSRGMS